MVIDTDVDWVEKHRPHSLSEAIYDKDVVDLMQYYIQTGVPNLLFVGSQSGTGKTTLAKILSREICQDADGDFIPQDYLFINASFVDMDTIKNRLWDFCRYKSWGLRKLIVLDEADSIPTSKQMALRTMMEQYTSNVCWILTGNDSERFHKAIVSRCQVIEFGRADVESIKSRLEIIAGLEGVRASEDELLRIAQRAKGDFRNGIQGLRRLQASKMVIT